MPQAASPALAADMLHGKVTLRESYEKQEMELPTIESTGQPYNSIKLDSYP